MITVNRGETTILKGADVNATKNLKQALNFAKQRVLQFSNKKQLKEEESINRYVQIKKDVINLIKENKYEDFIYGLYVVLHGHQKQIDYLESQLKNSSSEEQKTIKKSIEEFKNKLSDTQNFINEVEKAKKEYEAEEKEKNIKKTKNIIEFHKKQLSSYFDSITTAFSQLDAALEKPEEYLPIMSLTKLLKNVIAMYRAELKQVKKNVNKFRELSKEDYDLGMPDELEQLSQTKKRYRKARLAIDEFELKIQDIVSDKEDKDITQYTQVIASLQNVLSLTSFLIPNRKQFAEIQQLSNSEINTKHHKMTLQKFSDEISVELEKYYLKLIEDIKNLRSVIGSREFVKSINDRYTTLSKEEKNKIFETENSNAYKKICFNDISMSDEEKNKRHLTYDYLINFITRITPHKALTCLEDIPYNSEEFNQKYKSCLKEIINFIHAINTREEAEALGVKAEFDEETQTLLVSLGDNTLGIYKKQLVSDEVLNKMRQDRKNIIVYPEKSWLNTSKEKVEIQMRYCEVIEEINHLIRQLNDYAKHPDNSSKTPIELDRDILEYPSLKTATYCERIIELRTEMIDIALEYFRKYRISINTLPDIKDIKLNEVHFSSSNKEFVVYHNQRINELIKQIDSLPESGLKADELEERKVRLSHKINIENNLLTNRLAIIGMQKDLNLSEILSSAKGKKSIDKDNITSNSEDLTDIKEMIEQRIQKLSQEDILTYAYEKAIIKLIDDIKKYYASKIPKDSEITYDLINNNITIKNNEEVLMIKQLLSRDLYQQFITNGRKVPLKLLKQVKIAVLNASVADYNNGERQRTIRKILEDDVNVNNSEIDEILDTLVKEGIIQNIEARADQTSMSFSKLNQLISEESTNVKVKQTHLNISRQQHINHSLGTIISNAKPITISLIKNGLKIKLSQELSDKLSSLKAKISLVNKNNYRDRKSTPILKNDELEHELSFTTGNRDIKKDYKIEIRKPKESSKNSEVIYEQDLDSNEEIKKGI